jgi:serine/threonine protein kinase
MMAHGLGGTATDAHSAWCLEQIGRSVIHGRYVIARNVPGEAPGEYFAARDTTTGEDVTTRILRLRALPDGAALVRLRHDLRRVAGSPHPHIVRAWDHSASDGMLVIATEPHGTSLRQMLAQRRLGASAAIQIAQQVGAALAFAHAHGVAHGLLTPACVDITPSGSARVDGFGLAAVAPFLADHIPGDRAIRPGYFPPELDADDWVTPQTDMFQLGALLCELLTGTPPAPHSTAANLAPLPPALRAIVAACLQPRHQDRPHDIADLLVALRQARQAAEAPAWDTATQPRIAITPVTPRPATTPPAPRPPLIPPRPLAAATPPIPGAFPPDDLALAARQVVAALPARATVPTPLDADDPPFSLSQHAKKLIAIGSMLATLALLLIFARNAIFTAHAAPPHPPTPTATATVMR